MKKIKLGIAAWKITPIITNEELNLDCVISRFLVVYDNESKEHLKMETGWRDIEVEGVEYEGGFRWRVVSEHKNEELALNEARELNNGL